MFLKIFIISVILIIQGCSPIKPFGFERQKNNVLISGNIQVPQFKKEEVISSFNLKSEVIKINKVEEIKRELKKSTLKKNKTSDKETNKLNNNFKFKKFFNKNNFALTKVLGNPKLIIEHGIVKNYQYHFKNCHVDFFFKKIKTSNQILLVHFEMRPHKYGGIFNKSLCINDLSKKQKISSN